MGLTKTILFGGDPAHDGLRQEIREAAVRRVAAFPFSIRLRRKNRMGRGPYWDPAWASCVSRAANELGIENDRGEQRMLHPDKRRGAQNPRAG